MFTNPSKLVSRDQNSLLLDDLQQRTNDTMFDNSFADKHNKFDYSTPSDNEDDKTLDQNMIVNINDDVGNKIIPHVPKFRDAFGFSSIVSHDLTLSHRRMLEGFDLEIGKTLNNTNKLVNVVKWWHIAYLIEY